MVTVDKDKVEQAMESARDTARGTMELWVRFDTAEEVAVAVEWMSGKRKVKNLTPITQAESEKRKNKKYKEIARNMGIKE